jgi:hypothetical protein
MADRVYLRYGLKMAGCASRRYLIFLGLLVSTASCHQATRVSRLPVAHVAIFTITTFNVNYAQAGDKAGAVDCCGGHRGEF